MVPEVQHGVYVYSQHFVRFVRGKVFEPRASSHFYLFYLLFREQRVCFGDGVARLLESPGDFALRDFELQAGVFAEQV